MPYKLSKEELKKEILRCGRDPAYFLDNYVKVVHQEKGIIPFRTFPYQKKLLTDFHDFKFNVVLKSRQMGISTIVAGYSLWMMLFHKEKNILAMATKQLTAIEIVDKVREMYESAPEFLKLTTVAFNNRTKFELSNGSRIQGVPTSKDAGRGQALSLLIVDEAAIVENMDELWTGLAPTLSSGGRCIALSTPYGVGTWFHKTYVEAESNLNSFKPSKIMWTEHPDYTKEWFNNMTKNMSKRQIAQEFLCNFNTSGETVLEPECIEELKKFKSDPSDRKYIDHNLHVWKMAEDGASYILSADVSRGDGKDFSVFHVFDSKTMEQVAEYQGKIDLDSFAHLIFETGLAYGGCMAVVENNNIGYSVVTKLIDMKYPNVYYSSKTGYDTENFSSYTNTVPGFSTSMKTRPLIIAKFDEYARNKAITIRSSRLLNELDTFLWVNGRPEAQKNYNDDLIMAAAIACWVRDTAIINTERNTEYTKALLGAMYSSRTVFNTSINGMKDFDYNQRIAEKQNAYKEFLWVIKG